MKDDAYAYRPHSMYNEEYVQQVWAKRRREEEARNAGLLDVKAEVGTKPTLVWRKPEREYRVDYKGRRPAVDIIQEVGDQYGYSVEEIISQRRHHDILPVRAEAIWRVYSERVDMTTPQIGKVFNRDHSTIIHTVKKRRAK
jgi:Bacterial dnaA protein helix-turn-helix